MKYLIVPEESSRPSASADHEGWVASNELSLDGGFYDHLSVGAGPILGVRYWVDEAVVFDRHTVFKQFLTDRRFKFCQKECYVDIVFGIEHADALQHGQLEVRTVQDLGGESVMKNGTRLGILFCV